MTTRGLALLAMLAATAPMAAAPAAEDAPRLALEKGDRVVLIGNTLVERMQYFNNWETLLHRRFPDLDLVVRNLGWSADELALRPRSQGFQDHGHNLVDERPSVLIAGFGFNESFAGPDGLAKFRADLDAAVREWSTTKYDGKAAPRLVLLSPIAQEDLRNPHFVDGKANNKNIELYAEATRQVAAAHKAIFVDLFRPTAAAEAGSTEPLTINGIHLNDRGDRVVAEALDLALFGPPTRPVEVPAALKAAVAEKNLQFWYDYRAINGCYIYGSRESPFGVVNFPAEFAKLRRMTADRDARIWEVAKGRSVPDAIDDSKAGDLVRVETNRTDEPRITSPEESRKTFKLPEGYEANLFASEVEFPDLRKPVQMAIDARGRIWVTTMPSYPMYLPGRPADDKVLIFEDADGDGRADKQTVFADKLHVPTGIELGDGGAYVAQQPNLMFLKDTDGDDKADSRSLILHGFDSADSHHAIHAFTWDPGGALYFQEGVFHRSQVETPRGPVRLADAGIFRFEPRTLKFGVFVSYPFANPWGHYVDRWGQNFVADASGGANYYGTAFSGEVIYPHKHGGMEQFLKMQWRPTCGCELVSSRNFPDDTQGDYLLNNDIGFQGILRYKVREDGSGFHADPVEPLLDSKDPNFRPVDLEFAPDGSLYVVDWFNPLVGHMQHSLRDPKRDVEHGRIWRITYKGRPLVTPAKVAGAPVAALLELLKAPEDRTRYRARRELHERPAGEVLAAADAWVGAQSASDPDYWHNQLEHLWLHQAFDAVDADLLKSILTCPEPKARAAATRVLGCWRDRVPNALERLRTQVNDAHPRVRLEAVRALSFFDGADVPKAQEIALESLLQPQDYYLEYMLNETNKTLDERAKAIAKAARR